MTTQTSASETGKLDEYYWSFKCSSRLGVLDRLGIFATAGLGYSTASDAFMTYDVITGAVRAFDDSNRAG